MPGIAELKVDVNKGKPAMSVKVDREKQVVGISAGQVGTQLRRSIFERKQESKEKAKTMT
jgi:hypothetical protein